MQANRSDNGNGPQVPNPEKFPDGMAAVADHIHVSDAPVTSSSAKFPPPPFFVSSVC